MDDVSELAVNSPDEGSEDGPHLLLPSPGGHPEDQKSSAGSGQRVGRHMQILHNSSVRMQMWNKGRGDKITVLTVWKICTPPSVFPARRQRAVALKPGRIAAAV